MKVKSNLLYGVKQDSKLGEWEQDLNLEGMLESWENKITVAMKTESVTSQFLDTEQGKMYLWGGQYAELVIITSLLFSS